MHYILLLAAAALGAAPKIEKTDVFHAGTAGYASYRIPGITVTGKGTVLVYGEARKSTRGDWGTIDIVMKRSTDGGRTFGEQRVIASVPGEKSKNPVALAQKLATTNEVTYNNPVAIAGKRAGTVHFVFCLEYMRAFYMRSDDDGLTFSAPREITQAFEGFRANYDWKVLATGPGHGIRLKNGRLLIPVWISTGTGGHAHRPSVAGTIYSDDEGMTWRAGDIALPNEGNWTIPNETAAVELADGRVLLNSRTESKAHRRLLTSSPNGATNWTRPEFHPELLEPICMGSMARLTFKGKYVLLFSNPDNLSRTDGKEVEGRPRDRKNVTVKASYDDAKSWPVSRAIEPGPSGYSDLAVLRDGTILLFYEHPKGMTVARFNMEWLTEKR
ncbi:MAG: exo-alpha-sialidase [Acidobacteria bacterium]|nr:exo-alpha-sialidase [Acidobacteriota bacterium]